MKVLEVEVVTTKVVMVEEVSEELVIIMEKKDIDLLNVHRLVRRPVVV